ncbi:MAG: hypothetical protein IJB47_02660 [Oscillospiraceae bacterium]|nr:hypothetical protein [Oscillospiraceae bacterium]
MQDPKIEWVYASMASHIQEKYRFPGVEDAFAEGSYCMECYGRMRDAYDRLCDRLNQVDEDPDVEIILQAMGGIERELCFRMYRYGALFGLSRNAAGD